MLSLCAACISATVGGGAAAIARPQCAAVNVPVNEEGVALGVTGERPRHASAAATHAFLLLSAPPLSLAPTMGGAEAKASAEPVAAIQVRLAAAAQSGNAADIRMLIAEGGNPTASAGGRIPPCTAR